jgi:hypothetical protein
VPVVVSPYSLRLTIWPVGTKLLGGFSGELLRQARIVKAFSRELAIEVRDVSDVSEVFSEPEFDAAVVVAVGSASVQPNRAFVNQINAVVSARFQSPPPSIFWR